MIAYARVQEAGTAPAPALFFAENYRASIAKAESQINADRYDQNGLQQLHKLACEWARSAACVCFDRSVVC